WQVDVQAIGQVRHEDAAGDGGGCRNRQLAVKSVLSVVERYVGHLVRSNLRTRGGHHRVMRLVAPANTKLGAEFTSKVIGSYDHARLDQYLLYGFVQSCDQLTDLVDAFWG